MTVQAAALQPADASTFARWLEWAVDVYTAAMNAPRDHLGGRRGIMERHLDYPGFRGYLALRGEALVGFCYGFHGGAGQWWHDAVYRELGRSSGDMVSVWLADCFEIAELQVLPHHQRRGIGRALLTELCGERAERTVLLSTHDAQSPARHLYYSLGFTDLLTRFRFPAGYDEFAVLGAPLPLPGASRT